MIVKHTEVQNCEANGTREDFLLRKCAKHLYSTLYIDTVSQSSPHFSDLFLSNQSAAAAQTDFFFFAAQTFDDNFV